MKTAQKFQQDMVHIKDENQDFYYKSSKAHFYHFDAFYLTSISNKKIDTLQH